MNTPETKPEPLPRATGSASEDWHRKALDAADRLSTYIYAGAHGNAALQQELLEHCSRMELLLRGIAPNDRTELRLPGSAATTTPKI